MVGARWMKRLLAYLGSLLERVGRWLVQRGGAGDQPSLNAPPPDIPEPPEHWLARVRAAKGWEPRGVRSNVPRVISFPTPASPPSPVSPNGDGVIASESPLERADANNDGETATPPTPDAPRVPLPEAPRKTAPLRPIQPANPPAPPPPPSRAPLPPQQSPAAPARETSPRLTPDPSHMEFGDVSSGALEVVTSPSKPAWRGRTPPSVVHTRSARSAEVPRVQPAVPELRRHDETVDERDHDAKDPWPELPEWALPQSSHEDLMLLLREEERRLRLKAEQMGSSWSAPPS